MTTPESDFYNYCNLEWIEKNEIPAGYSRWTRFNELNELNLSRLQDLIKNNDNKIIKLILEGFNKKEDYKIINRLILEINEKESVNDLLKYYMEKLNKLGFSVLYDLGKSADFKDCDMNIVYLSPSGLFLPDKHYYLNEEFKEKREELIKYLRKLCDVFSLEINLEEILNFELSLAKLFYEREELRNPLKIYHPTTLEDLPKYLNIDLFFKSLNKKAGKIINCNPEYFRELESLLDLDILKSYFILKVISNLAGKGQGRLYDINFDFYGKVIQGTKEKLPLWKREVNLVNNYLGEMFGKEYVEKYFSEEDKSNVLGMIKHLKSVLSEIIKKNTWMREGTKERALIKLEHMTFKIGYPNKWRDFSSLNISDLETFYEKILKINEWWFYQENKEIYEPVDKDEWHMLPQTVNAYYNPTSNEIVFPAAILQPPFYGSDRTKAENYGGIGVVIAHEITHGFDDEGKKFDEKGNLNNWWEEEDEKEFHKEADKLVRQFNNLTFNGSKLNGQLTLGENLADLGGVLISLEGLKNDLGKLSNKEKREFFESYAQLWATLITEEESLRLSKVDPHSPGYYRVNGILVHVDDFYETYGIDEKCKMHLYEKDRCKIWRF